MKSVTVTCPSFTAGAGVIAGLTAEGSVGFSMGCEAILLAGEDGVEEGIEMTIGSSVGDAAAGGAVVEPSVVGVGLSGETADLDGDAAAGMAVVVLVVVESVSGGLLGFEGDAATVAVVVVPLVVVVGVFKDALGCDGEADGDCLLVVVVVSDRVGPCTVAAVVSVDCDCVVGVLLGLPGVPALGLVADGLGCGTTAGLGLIDGDGFDPCPSC